MVRPTKDNGKGTQMILRRRRRRASPGAEFNPSSSAQTMMLRTQAMTHHVDSAINNTTIGIHRNLDGGIMKSTMAQDAVEDSFAASTLTKIAGGCLKTPTNNLPPTVSSHSSCVPTGHHELP